MRDFDFYFITDSLLSKNGIVNDVRAAIRAGVRIVQYREKEKTTREMVKEARILREMCRKAEVTFVVNDRVDVALACDADGVHIGEKDMDFQTARKILGEDKIIGVSVSSLNEAKEFEKLGANYVSFGPIFETKTKKDAGKPIGIDVLEEASKTLRIPFVAIGGINQENLREVLETGCTRVCMISAILKGDVEDEIRKVRRVINEYATRAREK